MTKPQHCKSERRCIDYTWASNEWRGKDKECLLCGCDGDTRIISAEKVPVYQYIMPILPKKFSLIKWIKLALNDIGDNEDGFSRLDLELENGEVIQFLRQEREQG